MPLTTVTQPTSITVLMRWGIYLHMLIVFCPLLSSSLSWHKDICGSRHLRRPNPGCSRVCQGDRPLPHPHREGDRSRWGRKSHADMRLHAHMDTHVEHTPAFKEELYPKLPCLTYSESKVRTGQIKPYPRTASSSLWGKASVMLNNPF